jgi:putative ABC transport system permease protein
MIRNYFTLAVRNLVRHRNFSLLNIVGLMIGIVCSIVIFLLVKYEYSFDKFHSRVHRLYRVVTQKNLSGGVDYDMGTPFPMARTLRTEVPMVQNAAAFFEVHDNQIDVLDDQKNATSRRFNEPRGVAFAEPEFFEMFDFPWLAGTPRTSLSEPRSVVLTQSMAEKYFGDWKSAVGRFLQLSNQDILTVTGVLANPPSNTDFPIQVIISYKTLGENLPGWESGNSNQQCYVLLSDKMEPQKVDEQLAALTLKYEKPPIVDKYLLQPLNQIHFDSRFGNYNRRTVSQVHLKALMLIGIFLLAMACVNFINLSTAQVMNRAKEAGVRKVLGGYRLQLMTQWMTEAFVIVFISVAGGLVSAALVLPALNPILGLPLHVQLSDPMLIIFALGLLFFVTIFSSVYPGLILSGYKPILALKNKISGSGQKLSSRKALVVFQFLIAQLLIIATIVVMKQTHFFENTSLGFDKDAIVTVPIRSDSTGKAGIEPLRAKLSSYPGIRELSFAITSPAADRPNWWTSFRFRDATKDEGFELNLKFADTGYFRTYGLSLVAGRIYSSSDTIKEAVVNETLLKKLGVRNPDEVLGKNLIFWDKKVPIVGVVKDFHVASLKKEIVPVAMTTNTDAYWRMSARLKPQNIKQTIAGIEKAYASVFPKNIFEYQFVDESLAAFYAQEEKLSKLFRLFSLIGIGISCLGLLALVSFMAVQRTKEIGIRKVLGASAINISNRFFKEFAMLTLLAFVIAAPVGWYFMNKWLEDYPYRIHINGWVFALTGLISLLIALLTVSFQSIKAAVANPVKSLRTE